MRRIGAALLLIVARAAVAAGQAPTPTPTPVSAIAAPAETPPAEPRSATPEPTATPLAPEPDRSGILPSLNVYLPEGRADIRLMKAIRNSLFDTYHPELGEIQTRYRPQDM